MRRYIIRIFKDHKLISQYIEDCEVDSQAWKSAFFAQEWLGADDCEVQRII